MIKYYHDLFVDDYVRENLDRCMQEAEAGRISIAPLYCVAIASNKNNLLDILSCNELYFKYYKKQMLYVLGLAASYREALRLTEKIIMTVYNETGAFDVRDFYFGQIVGM